MQVPQGVKISAYIMYVYALITLCGVLTLAGIGLTGSLGAVAEEMDLAGVGAITAVLGVLTCFLLLTVVLHAAAGYGLLQLKNWARILAIVLAALNILNFPLGTILGGIILYYLLADEESKQAFS
ncbi:MAG: hypothetical protein KDJ65_17800 [Anaerolineae bacterium]|nr:hypothetical protein [Anaerolineae bacterium]